MITDYHIQIIVGKIDKLIEVQSEILSRLTNIAERTEELEQLKQTMETIMEQEQKTIPETPQSVTITESGEPKVSTATENEASKTKDSAKKFNKTQAFKDYKAAGGELSWNKWKAAGMPLVP